MYGKKKSVSVVGSRVRRLDGLLIGESLKDRSRFKIQYSRFKIQDSRFIIDILIDTFSWSESVSYSKSFAISKRDVYSDRSI